MFSLQSLVVFSLLNAEIFSLKSTFSEKVFWIGLKYVFQVKKCVYEGHYVAVSHLPIEHLSDHCILDWYNFIVTSSFHASAFV